jgi:hypothetical protein
MFREERFMASALPALPIVSESADHTHSVSPAWWRRRHTYATPIVVAGEIGLSWLAVLAGERIVGPGGTEELLSAALIGFLVAKCFLLGLWAALGSPRTIPRWLLVGGLGLLGALVVASRFFEDNPDLEERISLTLLITLFTWITAAGYAAALLPLRRLAGWRIDFDAAYHPATGQRRGQMGLMDFAAMSCAIALPLTLGRCLIEVDDSGDATGSLLSILLLGALIAITAAPAAYAVLTRRRTWLWPLAAALWLLIIAAGQSLLSMRFPDLDFFGGTRFWGLDLTPFGMHAGATLAVIVPLALLRPFGLKLLTVQ